MMGWHLFPHSPPCFALSFPISACSSILQSLSLCVCLKDTHIHACTHTDTHTRAYRKSGCLCVLKPVNCFQGSFSACSHIFFQMQCVLCACGCVRAVRRSCPRGESSVCSLGVVGRCFLNRPPPLDTSVLVSVWKYPYLSPLTPPHTYCSLCVCASVCAHT